MIYALVMLLVAVSALPFVVIYLGKRQTQKKLDEMIAAATEMERRSATIRKNIEREVRHLSDSDVDEQLHAQGYFRPD